MSGDAHDPANYVNKVRQETRHYIEELLRELDATRTTVASLEKDISRLEYELERERERASSLQSHVSNMADENSAAFERYLTVEQENDSLANLYVSAYRLHGTLDPVEVLRAIQEIVVNLVGSEEFAIFERSQDGEALQLVAGLGVATAGLAHIPVGTGRIGGVVVSGEAFLAAETGGDGATDGLECERHLTACVPLRIDGEVTGAIAIFRLLEQKPGLERIDFEIFDLLASQAATALHAARLHARYWRVGGDGRR